MKRIWIDVAVIEHTAGFGVTLDGRPVRLPGGTPLAVPSEALAHAIAAEWNTPRETLVANDLPLTRLAGTALERVAPDPSLACESLLAYGSSDLLCYRATGPDGLVAEQHRHWQPWLDWAATTLDAPLAVTAGIGPIAQPETTIARFGHELGTHTPWTIAGLGVIVPALGSLVLGLAIARGALDTAKAHALTSLDETWQERRWGTDAEAAARRARIEADIASAARFVNLARS